MEPTTCHRNFTGGKPSNTPIPGTSITTTTSTVMSRQHRFESGQPSPKKILPSEGGRWTFPKEKKNPSRSIEERPTFRQTHSSRTSRTQGGLREEQKNYQELKNPGWKNHLEQLERTWKKARGEKRTKKKHLSAFFRAAWKKGISSTRKKGNGPCGGFQAGTEEGEPLFTRLLCADVGHAFFAHGWWTGHR